uniref:Uncharacterized protein n=1 Tax=Chloropicon laureae TaxID=464258 RepID=A0A7S2Z745_9CHLO
MRGLARVGLRARRARDFVWRVQQCNQSAHRQVQRHVTACSSSSSGGGGGGDGDRKRDGSKLGEGMRLSSKGFGTAGAGAGAGAGTSSSSAGSGPKIFSDEPSNWKEIDDKVNKYPIERHFQAIGTGGEDFKLAMVSAVESTLGCSVPASKVSVRSSSGGKYLSVNIGPVVVDTSEQLTAVYTAMSSDERLKWWM